MLVAASCGKRAVTLVVLLSDTWRMTSATFKHQADYTPPAPPAEPIGVDPDDQPQHRFRLRSNDRLDRLPVSKFDPAAMDDNERAAFLAVMAEPDTQPVVDQFRRFGAYFVAGGWIECDLWRIIPISDAAGNPVEHCRMAQSGLSVSGEADPWTMPEPILSPDPQEIAPLDDVEYACLGSKRGWRTKQHAIDDGIETIADFLRRLADCIDIVQNCGS